MLPIEQGNISTIVWSKTTVESSSATIPCEVLGPLKERHASAVLSMNCGTPSVFVTSWAKWSLSWNNGKLFFSVWSLFRE